MCRLHNMPLIAVPTVEQLKTGLCKSAALGGWNDTHVRTKMVEQMERQDGDGESGYKLLEHVF